MRKIFFFLFLIFSLEIQTDVLLMQNLWKEWFEYSWDFQNLHLKMKCDIRKKKSWSELISTLGMTKKLSLIIRFWLTLKVELSRNILMTFYNRKVFILRFSVVLDGGFKHVASLNINLVADFGIFWKSFSSSFDKLFSRTLSSTGWWWLLLNSIWYLIPDLFQKH